MKRLTGTGLAIAAAAVLAAGSGAAAASRTGLSAGQVSPAHRPAAAGTGSSAISNLGASGGWKVLTSATATQTGQQISTPGFNTTGWLSVTNDDAGAPGTEIEALLQNGT